MGNITNMTCKKFHLFFSLLFNSRLLLYFFIIFFFFCCCFFAFCFFIILSAFLHSLVSLICFFLFLLGDGGSSPCRASDRARSSGLRSSDSSLGRRNSEKVKLLPPPLYFFWKIIPFVPLRFYSLFLFLCLCLSLSLFVLLLLILYLHFTVFLLVPFLLVSL